MDALPAGWDAERLKRLAGHVAEAATKQPPNGRSRWLHGPHYTDIFVDYDDHGQILLAEISFGGHLVRWEQGRPYTPDPPRLYTGATDEMTVDRAAMPGSRFIQEHARLDGSILNAVRVLLENISDRELAESLLSKIRSL